MVAVLSEYLPLVVLFLVSLAVAVAALALGALFGPRRPTARKAEPYESGMRPFGPGRRRVPIHFYLVAVLFLLFDIEIVFIFPWAVVLGQLGLFGLVEMAVFVVVLLIGYVYAFKKGALEWE
ncbi:MAG TPA: NADH-quinone oxidoreductase subunit A [Anaerolineales bacterium]|nr:NADH-quinone oxidoreductase subunit A [Anaerolineales bacterium]